MMKQRQVTDLGSGRAMSGHSSKKTTTAAPSTTARSSSVIAFLSFQSASSFVSSLFTLKLPLNLPKSKTFVALSSVLVAVIALVFLRDSSNLTHSWFCKATNYLYFNISTCKEEVFQGDWRLPSDEVWVKFASDKCNIERLSVLDLTPDRFETDFRYKRPVIVTFPNGAADWTQPRDWSKKGLTEKYSHWTIRSGESLEIVRAGGNGKHVSSFVDYVSNLIHQERSENDTREPKNYACDRDFFWYSKLGSSLHLPKYFQINTSLDESIFFLGPSLSGVVFHKHSDTWNGVVYGYKRWFLYPNTKTPPGGVHHGFSLMDWFKSVYPKLSETDKPMECVQGPGEIIYVPEGTYHATLNLGDTVAVAIQKRAATTKEEKLSYEATQLINFLSMQENPEPKNVFNQRLREIYTKWHEYLPESSEAVMKLGAILVEMEEYTDSLYWLNKAVEMDPFFIIAYHHLGEALTQLLRYHEAEKVLLKAIELSPNLWDNYRCYGEYLMKMGRHKDALPVFKKGMDLEPDMIPFWFYYKTCQVHLGDMEGAEATEKIIKDIQSKQEQ